jgi:hypothetical protein
MTWNEAASGSSGLFEGGFGWGGVLLVIGMVVALAIVSGLGILARLRDRASERKALDVKGSASGDQRSDAAAAG